MEILRNTLFQDYKHCHALEQLNDAYHYTEIYTVFQRFFDFLSTEKDSRWASQLFRKSKGSKEIPTPTATDTVAATASKEGLSE